jgi:CRP-like cAMP-binding protein
MEHAGLSGHSLFQMLQPKQVERISNATQELTFEPGEVVYHAGEAATYFYVVREGKVTLHSVVGGVTLHVDDVLPGEIFGTCLCLSRSTYALEARCEERSKLMRIPAEALKRTLNDDPVLGYALQAYISGIYFRRYTDALARLQSVVESLRVRPQ